MVLDLLDIPSDTYPARTITTGATASNILGLALAREALIQRLAPGHSTAEDGRWLGQILGYAADGHASIKKAAALLGIGRKNIRNGRTAGLGPAQLDLEDLEGFLKECAEQGIGSIVFPSYGEVNTVSLDVTSVQAFKLKESCQGAFTGQMQEIRQLCDKYNAWIHLDAGEITFFSDCQQV